MKPLFASPAAALVIAALSIAPALAEPGKNNGNGNGHGNKKNHGGEARQVLACPPGLAKKDPACVPPGLAKKGAVRHGTRVGDVLRVGDHVIVSDPRRYDLEPRAGWDYYRDDNTIYRVDSGTRRVLAVLNLVDAFSN